MSPKIIGVIVMAAGAALTFTSSPVAKALFKCEDPTTDKRAIAIKLAGLAAAIVGMLMIFEII